MERDKIIFPRNFLLRIYHRRRIHAVLYHRDLRILGHGQPMGG